MRLSGARKSKIIRYEPLFVSSKPVEMARYMAKFVYPSSAECENCCYFSIKVPAIKSIGLLVVVAHGFPSIV